MKKRTEEHNSKTILSQSSMQEGGLFHRLLEACGGIYYAFSLAALFVSGAVAGALLAHTSLEAEATTSPYLFSGNIVRMPINTSRVTGEQSTKKASRNELEESLSSLLKEGSVRQKIRYTFMNSQNATSMKVQETAPHGLVSFGNGVVSILTDDETVPFKLTPSSSAILPSFVLGRGDNGASSLSSYISNKNYNGTEKLALSITALPFSHCAIQREIKREGLQKFIDTFEAKTDTTREAMHSLKYRSMVEHYAAKYRLAPELILGIIRTESNFNPYAVSQSQALGLMQIVPSTAGEEVYSYLTGQEGSPSPELLFQPEKNIQYGTIYLHLLNTRYFQGVSNVVSRRLLMIAAYNGGPNAVLRVFSPSNGEAIAIVNNLTPDLVYKELTEKMPRIESRLYVDRVLDSIQSFINS